MLLIISTILIIMVPSARTGRRALGQPASGQQPGGHRQVNTEAARFGSTAGRTGGLNRHTGRHSSSRVWGNNLDYRQAGQVGRERHSGSWLRGHSQMVSVVCVQAVYAASRISNVCGPFTRHAATPTTRVCCGLHIPLL